MAPHGTGGWGSYGPREPAKVRGKGHRAEPVGGRRGSELLHGRGSPAYPFHPVRSVRRDPDTSPFRPARAVSIMESATSTGPRFRTPGPSLVLRGLFALAGLTAILVARPAAAIQQGIGEGAIVGQVVDEATGEGVPAVQVEVLDGRAPIPTSALGDGEGRFSLPRVPAGSFRLRVSRLGYAPATTPPAVLEAGELLTVTVRLRPEAVYLAPLEVTARTRSASPLLEGYYHRVDRGLGGHFLTREDITRLGPLRVSDLLATVPGVEVTSPPGFGPGSRLVSMAGAFPGRAAGGCPVQVFVDGVLANRPRLVAGGGFAPVDGVPVDDLADPSAIEGIEVYRDPGFVPAEFATPDAGCGVIAIWTRRDGWN